ncbi:hypothetical protein ACT7C1_33690 [Bacillus paranthracis]
MMQLRKVLSTDIIEIKKDSKDKFIDVVACDDHAKEKDFYPKENRNETNI